MMTANFRNSTVLIWVFRKIYHNMQHSLGVTKSSNFLRENDYNKSTEIKENENEIPYYPQLVN